MSDEEWWDAEVDRQLPKYQYSLQPWTWGMVVFGSLVLSWLVWVVWLLVQGE